MAANHFEFFHYQIAGIFLKEKYVDKFSAAVEFYHRFNKKKFFEVCTLVNQEDVIF